MTALTLTVGFLLLSSFTVMSIIPEPSGELRGGMTLRIHPDQRVELEVSASSVWEMEPWDYSPGFREMSLSATITPSGTDRYESMGTIEMVLNPDYFPDFPDVELNIDSTWDPPQAESSIMLNVPGYIAVEGETTYVTDEEISESTFDMEFSLMIWYDLLPREYIEMMVENFLLLKPELVTQLIDLTDGYIEVEELDVAESDFGLTYASLTLKLTIVGDFVNGMLALYDELEEYFPEAEIDTTMDPEILGYVKSSSSEVHMEFSSEDMTLRMTSSGITEGDLDGLVNAVKDQSIEQSLQDYDIDEDTRQFLEEFLIPTEFGVSNLDISSSFVLLGETSSFEFELKGLEMRSLDTNALLTSLGDASDVVEEPAFTLTLEGVEEGDEYVEIMVPPETSEPISQEEGKVVWEFDDIDNLGQVTFEVKQRQGAGLGLLTNKYLLPAVGAVVVLAAVGFVIMSRR